MALSLAGNKEFNVIGQVKTRRDGFDKVTGRAKFGADNYMENMLYGGHLRSPYSSAKVVSIDAEAARAIPGVAAVVTCFDIKKQRSWAGYMYVTDHIRYAGDCVALVAAESPELVDEALEAIKVEYEEIPGVYTVEDALKPGAPVLHEAYPDNIFKESVYPIRKGDVEKGFAEADYIIEREYRTQYIEHSYIEPEAAIAYIDHNTGFMTVKSSSQHPFFTRRYVADVTGRPMSESRVIQQYVGGSFGGKEEGLGILVGRACTLAQLTGRPVKYVFTREDSFLESSKRHPFRLRYKAGVTKDGKIIAWEGEQVDNCGAYNNQSQFMNWRASVHSAGPYEIENVKTDTYGVFTNNIHSGAMRGYSSPQLIWAQEQFINEIAEEIGMDEVEFRRRNLLTNGALTATGVPVEEFYLKEIMEYTLEQTDYVRKRDEYKKQTSKKRRKGIGFTTCYRGAGFGAESPDASGCLVIVNEDGSVTINTGLAENGQGLHTAFSQIAAEAIGVRYEDVRFYGNDTHSIADSGMTAASRGTVMGAQGTKKAGLKMHGILIKNAYDTQLISLSEVEKAYDLPEGSLSYRDFTEDDIDLVLSEFFFKKYPKVRVPLSAGTAGWIWGGLPLACYEWFKPEPFTQKHETGQGTVFPCYAIECVVAEVEVDMETGYVDVTNVTASHDVGTLVNPQLARGQIYGGILMGQGYGVMEDVAPSKGVVRNKNFDNYIIPTAMDAPKMTINIFECDDPHGTYGAKSLGEPATEAVGGAIANAIANATGRRIRENPCDLESVLLGHKLSK